jgi:tRNA threonylcarbamoyladenosine biosynthesis protein TsaB
LPVPTLFAIDTAGEHCSLALLRDGHRVQVQGESGRTHLEHVMPMVDELFASQGIAPSDCDAFAFGSGPGSFTGLRVACTLVQGLAFGTRRPVIAVGNLEAIAVQAAVEPPPPARQGSQRVLVAVDARMSQAYLAVFSGAASRWDTLQPASLVDAADLPALVRHWRPQVCAGEANWLGRCLGRAGDIGGGAQAAQWALRNAVADAGAIITLAEAKLARGDVLPPERATPQYVRDDVARTVAQRRTALASGTT